MYLVIHHNKGHNVRAKAFKTREEAERYIHQWTIEAIGGEKYFEEHPENRKRFEDIDVIYQLDYAWGEDNSCCIMLLCVNDDLSVNVLIPRHQ